MFQSPLEATLTGPCGALLSTDARASARLAGATVLPNMGIAVRGRKKGKAWPHSALRAA